MPGAIATSAAKLNSVADVEIDPSGKFKYILCKVYVEDEPTCSKHIVRGTARAEYHSDIYDELDAQLEASGLICECQGGGKIEHTEKAIEVFGQSQGYGKADHQIAVDVLRRRYTDYTNISVRD